MKEKKDRKRKKRVRDEGGIEEIREKICKS